MNMKDIKVVDNNVSFNTVIDYIAFVVNKSFGVDGMYHKYLRDFAEASAIISMYTDYDNTEFDMNEVMNFIQSDEWRTIKQQLGQRYDIFDRYVEYEIVNLNTPLRFADNTLKAMTVAINKINIILNSIDIDKLKEYDFTKIVNAIDELKMAQDNKQNTK